MKIKNYTTSVPASKSVAEIEALLVQFGASKIQKEYAGDGQLCVSLAFILRTSVKGESKEIPIKLPANVNSVLTLLESEKKRRRYGQDLKLREQAERVAWRVLKDWLHAQLSLIQIGQAEPTQIFLPYVWDGRETLYERMMKSGNLLGYNEEK